MLVTQVVGSDTEGNGDVERRFYAAHGDVKHAVAERQELRINAGTFVTYNEDEEPFIRARRGAKEVPGPRPALQCP